MHQRVIDYCIYKQKRDFFPVLVDNMTLAFTHSYTTEILGKNEHMPHTFVRLTNDTSRNCTSRCRMCGCADVLPHAQLQA